MSYDWAWFLATIIGILVIALPLMLAVAMIIYAERKIWAAIALRRGSNVVGPWGLLQSFADGLKVFLKETIVPTSANKGLFLIAPIVTFTVALIVWAVVPFAPGVVLANINVGLLYILAASSLGVYGVIVAGWASNSKYPFFSALRAAAQMVSYEVSIGFVLITVVLYAGTFNLSEHRLAQTGLWARHRQCLCLQPAAVPDVGGVPDQLDGRNLPHAVRPGRGGERARRRPPDRIFVDELRALLARRICQRHPDVRAQRHPVLGRVAAAGRIGRRFYFIPGIGFWLFLKMSIFFFMFGWVKATVPRYRYDQLMRLGWKIFLPLSLVFVVLVSGWLMLTRYGGAA